MWKKMRMMNKTVMLFFLAVLVFLLQMYIFTRQANRLLAYPANTKFSNEQDGSFEKNGDGKEKELISDFSSTFVSFTEEELKAFENSSE